MITRAVIPAAGAGTRLLPATKALPKVMLPVLDRPAIQYVVEEAVESGIEDILIVTGKEERAIQDHFGHNPELEARLEQRGDRAALEAVRATAASARIHYVPQPSQDGLGDAIACARDFVDGEPFAVLLGDTLFDAPAPVTRSLVEAYGRHRTPVLAVEHVSPDKVGRYGIVEGESSADGTVRVSRLVEKPRPGETTSTLAIASRYVLTPDIFDALGATGPGRGGEIQLTDALASMLGGASAGDPIGGVPMVAVPIHGIRYDIGDRLDYLRTILAFAMKREDFSEVVRSFAASLGAPESDS